MQERQGDRIKDGLQIEMTEREKDGGKKKEKGEKGAGPSGHEGEQEINRCDLGAVCYCSLT